jgi:Ca-activated chloride channel family protein
LGIKIYTVGIGGDQQQIIMHPLYGPVVRSGVNKPLLTALAQQTGGQYFEAKSMHDMRAIYETIDKLEKVEYETNIFNKYYDIFVPFVWAVILFMILEIIVTSLIWFSL